MWENERIVIIVFLYFILVSVEFSHCALRVWHNRPLMSHIVFWLCCIFIASSILIIMCFMARKHEPILILSHSVSIFQLTMLLEKHWIERNNNIKQRNFCIANLCSKKEWHMVIKKNTNGQSLFLIFFFKFKYVFWVGLIVIILLFEFIWTFIIILQQSSNMCIHYYGLNELIYSNRS